MIEFTITGEVVKRIQNAKQAPKSGKGLPFAIDYIVVECDPRDTPRGEVRDVIPIEVFSSQVSEPYVQDVREGYRVEVDLCMECLNWKDEVEIKQFRQQSGHYQRSPSLWPKFKIKKGGLTILRADDRESRDAGNANFEKDIENPEDDLPF